MTPIDVVDILVVAYIIYRVMKLLKDTSAERLIKGIIILVGIMLLASMLHLTMISWLLQQRAQCRLVRRSWSCFSLSCAVCSSRSARATSAELIVPADRTGRRYESMIIATVSACADMSSAPRPARSSCSSAASVSARSSRTGTMSRCRTVRRADQEHFLQEQPAA